MARLGGGVSEGIDPAWLGEAAGREPVLHAYALWDLERAPRSTRFVTYSGANGARSYLLIWLGEPSAPIVHWVGDDPGDLSLADAIPPDVAAAVVPERAVPRVRQRLEVRLEEPVLIMSRPRAAPPPTDVWWRAIRLGPSKAEALRGFANRFPEDLTRAYRTIDLESERAYGSFDGPELVGVARVTVALPRIWIVSGVYVAPSARRSGHGRALTVAATSDARSAGAGAGLFVREHNEPALRLYQGVGYRPVARRALLKFANSSAAAIGVA